MKKNQKLGSVLSQYGIIIALIALALVPVFFLTGRYIVNYFESYTLQTKKNNEAMNANTTTSNSTQNTSNTNTSSTPSGNITDDDVIKGLLTAGQLGGTSEKPVVKCAGTVCTIDYGEFILNGIPSDFSGFVQSSGTSGGTEKLLAILDQAISKAANLNPPLDTSITEELSNQGHELASKQKLLETCVTEMNQLTLAQKQTASDKLNQITSVNQQASSSAGLFITLHDSFMKKYPNPTVQQQNLINTVDYVSKQIETLQTSMSSKADSAETEYGQQLNAALNTYSSSNNYFTLEKANDLLTPKISTNTNIKSGIICATGHGKDTGTQCN